jgi:multidrug resistance efflux pump
MITVTQTAQWRPINQKASLVYRNAGLGGSQVRNAMRNSILLFIILVIFVISGCSGDGGFLGRGQAEATATPLPAVQANPEVIVDAVVVPKLYADLSLKASGTVDEILVQEGDLVESGQLIARLDSERQVISIAQAEASVRSAQARIDELRAGSRPEEIAGAQAAVDAAQANLDRLLEGSRPEDIAAARAGLNAAEANLQQLLSGADDAELIQALADIQNAEAALRQAQAAYDEVKWMASVGALPQSAELERATNNYEAAKARYDLVAAGAKDNVIAGAQAEVEQARAALDKALAPATDSEIDAAQAQVRQAQSQLSLLQAGTRTETIQAAEADLTQAQTALMQRQMELDDTELRAPFAGTIASLDLDVGEQVAAGAPVVRLADQSEWRIETDDLTEINVVFVHEGDRARISVDALPDLDLQGTVVRIKPLGENKQGDITYTATIIPDTYEDRLRWNMSASVTIETGG